MNDRPRILFFGYSEVGYACLSLLIERGDNVVALITHGDSPHEKIWFKTPAVAAKENGIPVFTPESVNTPEWREKIAALKPDLILSVYYRHMIGTKILALPPLGAWNMHGSLLPKYRGRAPINWAVLHGESRIGMTLHRRLAVYAYIAVAVVVLLVELLLADGDADPTLPSLGILVDIATVTVDLVPPILAAILIHRRLPPAAEVTPPRGTPAMREVL